MRGGVLSNRFIPGINVSAQAPSPREVHTVVSNDEGKKECDHVEERGRVNLNQTTKRRKEQGIIDGTPQSRHSYPHQTKSVWTIVSRGKGGI